MSRPSPLVEAGWLTDHLDDPDLRVIDFRWYLTGPRGRDEYLGGHIPGAVFVDLEEVTGSEGGGRHPLPSREQFQAAMRRAGVSRDSFVVAYDDAGGSVAARLWFLLRLFGHDRAAVLDGGLQAWTGDLPGGDVNAAPGDFEAAEPALEWVLDYDGTERGRESHLLLDARAPERYRGEQEPVDPKAGHIPGARSAFFKGNLDESGRFLSPEQLRRRFRALGVDDASRVIAYCGSGVNACHNLLALERAGLRGARLYAGSWSDWSSHDGAPVATGEGG